MTTLVQSVSNLFDTVGDICQALEGQLKLINGNHEHIKGLINTIDTQQELIEHLENRIENLEKD